MRNYFDAEYLLKEALGMIHFNLGTAYPAVLAGNMFCTFTTTAAFCTALSEALWPPGF
jgi:hypothetical protein